MAYIFSVLDVVLQVIVKRNILLIRIIVLAKMVGVGERVQRIEMNANIIHVDMQARA